MNYCEDIFGRGGTFWESDNYYSASAFGVLLAPNGRCSQNLVFNTAAQCEADLERNEGVGTCE